MSTADNTNTFSFFSCVLPSGISWNSAHAVGTLKKWYGCGGISIFGCKTNRFNFLYIILMLEVDKGLR